MSGLESDQIRYAIQVAQAKGYRQVKIRLGEDKFSAVLAPVQTPADDEPVLARNVDPREVRKDTCVTSPSVGHFRAVAGQGDTVEPGDKIGEIIALGMANDVTSKDGGTVVEVCVSDGAAVEFGQTLLLVRQ